MGGAQAGNMAILWLLVTVVAAYLLYKLLIFVRADGDLTLLSKTLRPNYFKDKVIWITGASSGIGESLCHQLSRHGAKLILSARSVEKLERVKEALAAPENARILPLDLSDTGNVKAVAEKAQAIFGRVDILINNAGISMRALFLDFSDQLNRKMMEVDFFGPVALTHAVLPNMVTAGFGHIVNVSSVAGKAGMMMRTSYSAAKFALIGLMEAVRLEMVGKNVYITNVCPGPIKTAISENALTKAGTEFGVTDSLIEQGMSSERCAELILIGVSNQLHEVWISRHPVLLAVYLAQYSPSLLWLILKGRATKIINETIQK